MAEQRIGPRGKDGGEAMALLSEVCVPDRVDALVEPMQPTGRSSPRDSRRRVTERTEELAYRDDTVLARRQLGQMTMLSRT